MSGKTRELTRYALLILTGTLMAVFLISSASIIKSASPKAKTATITSTPVTPATAPDKHGPVEVVRFTLYDAGIYPRQARVQKGLVAIMIEDLSGGTSGVVVERARGNDRAQVGLVKRFEKHRRGRGEIVLTPGHYLIYDSSRPANLATLVVEP